MFLSQGIAERGPCFPVVRSGEGGLLGGGAELTGEGAFTFDNTDLVTFGGMPAPTGKLDLRLVGGNALMEKLVTLGILSAEDVMGANMMLSMFANPGPGEDEMSSTLEFKDKGFYANGQRLQ